MRNRTFLIFAAIVYVVIASLILDNAEHVLAFKPVGPVESVLDGSGNATAEPSLVADTSSFLDYKNSTFGMRIEYPSNWTWYASQNGSSELIVQFTDRPFNEGNNFTKIASRGGLAISGAPFTANSSTTDLSLWTQEQLNLLMTSLPSFRLNEMESMLLSARQQNIPATMTTYAYMDSTGHEVNAFIVDIFNDGRVYSMEYSAEPEVYHKNFPILLEMIDSFEIFESPQATMIVPASTRFSQYENATTGIKIEYPDNWMYKEEGDGVTFDFPGGFFYVAKTPEVNSTSEEESATFVNDVRQSLSGFSLIQAEPTKLQGANFTSSNLVIYTGSTDLGELYKYMDIVTVYNRDLYWIEYAADLNVYEIFQPTIQKMIDSFQTIGVSVDPYLPTKTTDFTREIVAEPEDETYISAAPWFHTSPDPDSRWAILEPTSHGTLSFFSPHSGIVTYTAYPGFTGKDSFTLTYENKIYLTSITIGNEIAAGSQAPAPASSSSGKFGLEETQDINLENGTIYPIKYKITGGEVSSMYVQRTSGRPSLVIEIIPEVFEDSYKGKLVAEIPRSVLNSVMVYDYGGGPAEWKELFRDPQTVVIEAAFLNYSPEKTTIEILGTR